MIIQARFGSAQTGLGYQFYSAAGTLLGSRITAGIVALPETGSYAADATVPADAVGVYWDSDTSEATEDLREALASPDVPSASEIADEVRAELAVELARIDVAVSTRNSTAPPAAAAIADAVWDEALAGHATAGTAGSQLTSAGASGDPWASVVPAAYADGTAGAAIGRLNNTPSAAPVIVVPAPDDDASLTVCYAYTENIANVKRAGIVLSFALVSTPAKSERLLEVAAQTATTDTDGYAQISLQSGLRYRVTSRELGLEKTFTPTGATFDLLTLIP